MGKPLDELYFTWLYGQVADPTIDIKSLTYWNVLRKLYTKPFVYVIRNDENRIADAKALRRRFVDSQGLADSVDTDWLVMGCSTLELMIALAERLEYLADASVHYWFWVLMENLGLHHYHDDQELPADMINEMLDNLMFRHYEKSGVGGFFPLNHVDVDQRKLELWDQMSHYLADIP